LPSTGIAQATGKDTLLFANGPIWRRQRKLAASPFGKTTLFQPETFHEFEETFRHTIHSRLEALEKYLRDSGETSIEIQLEAEVKAVMLEMLVNNFFGATLTYDEIRNRHVPALERVIDHIVRDTVMNKLGLPIRCLPSYSRRVAQTKQDYQAFEELTEIALSTRAEKKGLWRQFKSDAPDKALRSNVKVFLAGALEATTSYATWAISHLARDPKAQQRVAAEVEDIDDYSPENLARSRFFSNCLEETLRLTPSLYFLPRQASADTLVELSDGRRR